MKTATTSWMSARWLALQDCLKDHRSLPEETAAEVAEKLAEKWRTGRIHIDQAPIVLESVPEMEVQGAEADSDSQEDPAKVPRAEDRRSKYVIVELPGAIFRLHRSGANGCWMGRRREFRNSQEFPASINSSTPMFAASVGLGLPQPYREMGRR